MALTKAQLKNLENIRSGRGFQSNAQWERNPEYVAALHKIFLEVTADDRQRLGIPDPPETPTIEKPKVEEKRTRQDLIATLLCTHPIFGSYVAMDKSMKLTGNPDFYAISREIEKLAAGSDITEIQTMLAAQAVTLQAVFNYQMARVGNCGWLDQAEAVFSQAIRAQEQCRKTLATLAEIKNPKRPSQFIKTYVSKQLNQLRLEQQNSENFQPNPANELLRESADATVDIGGTAAATGTDPILETVGEIDGTENT